MSCHLDNGAINCDPVWRNQEGANAAHALYANFKQQARHCQIIVTADTAGQSGPTATLHLHLAPVLHQHLLFLSKQ